MTEVVVVPHPVCGDMYKMSLAKGLGRINLFMSIREMAVLNSVRKVSRIYVGEGYFRHLDNSILAYMMTYISYDKGLKKMLFTLILLRSF